MYLHTFINAIHHIILRSITLNLQSESILSCIALTKCQHAISNFGIEPLMNYVQNIANALPAFGSVGTRRRILRMILRMGGPPHVVLQTAAAYFTASFITFLVTNEAELTLLSAAAAVFKSLVIATIFAVLTVLVALKQTRSKHRAATRSLWRNIRAKSLEVERLSASLSRLELQRIILDKHAIVSETDCRGTITYANDAFCKISKHSRDELIGQNHRIVNSDFHPEEFWDDMYKTLSAGQVWQGEVCNRAKDGTLYWVMTTNAAVPGPNGRPVGYVSVRTDITESKLREQRHESTQQLLLEATAKAEAANIAKSDFLAIMSHEVRTPLNGIMGMLGLLSDAPLAPEHALLVRAAMDSSDSLLVIINDVLDYSKLEAGKIELEHISFNVSQILDGVVSLLHTRAASKSLPIKIDIVPGFPTWVLSDPTRLRQILFNLVGNAIKFTERGAIHILASHRTVSDDELELYFEVRDSGIGIPKEARGILFDRFTQADSSTTRKFGGTGLGLAISKQLAELLGGCIGVESEPGLGSRFWFTIRAERAGPPAEANESSVEVYNSLISKKLRILVADDNHVNQMFVKALLTKRGHTVDVVGNGKEAYESVQQINYDLVLMDVQMPEWDGPTASRRIRALSSPAASIPIIALTANAMIGQREEYLAAGMDDYVSKPIDPILLFNCIARHSSRSPREANPTPPTSLIEQIDSGNDYIDEQWISGLLVHLNPSDLVNALVSVPSETSESVKSLHTAIETSDAAGVRSAAHRLKGMAGNFGATMLRDLAEELEQKSADHHFVSASMDRLNSVIMKTNERLARLVAELSKGESPDRMKHATHSSG